MADRTITVTDNTTGEKIELPVLEGTNGPDCLDIGTLYKKLGYFTYDPGFVSTASCDSKITFIDGEQGLLRYRGYPIEQLAEHSTFLEVCYLLLHGELPDKDTFEAFENRLKMHTLLDEKMRRFYLGFHNNSHPMAMMVATVGAMSAFYHDQIDVHEPESRENAANRLIAKVPTMAAWVYKYTVGQAFMYPDNRLDYVSNFLYMMFGVPSTSYQPSPSFVRAMDLILILHADHEQNASTSTVRLAGSSGANPYAALSAGISSLWGPAHGGANEAVINMLEDILQSDKDVNYYIQRAKDKNSKFRLMGFGHRVYKNYDPRAKIIRGVCHQLLSELGDNNPNQPLFDTAMELERIALEDDYFIERKLYPNVDFYSGIILRAMGVPLNMFTVIFALARTVGWISHWKEHMSDPLARIGRPRQLYTGADQRDYVHIEERT